MLGIKVKILRITDYSFYPGYVECIVTDAWGNNHKFNEKIPVVTCKNIDEKSEFPQGGFIRCELLSQWTDDDENKIITVGTENPDHVETLDEINEFDLLPCQLVDILL